ncbi:hypothetical protein ACFC0D_07305 [Streptomyces sp. NPDC056222]|uniref:hypothetical protein n=1 Tax=Streptomyces sp. NPDC056222 TaxID=3345749 RepID=UPI0035E196FA
MGEWLVHCVLRYIPVLFAGHVLTSAFAPRKEGEFFWDSFGRQVGLSIGLTLALGAASLFLLLMLGLCKRYGTTGGFRTWALFLLILPVLPLIFGGSGSLFGIWFLAQVVFAIWIMPKPQLIAP